MHSEYRILLDARRTHTLWSSLAFVLVLPKLKAQQVSFF